MDESKTPQVTEKAEDEGGKGTQSISSSIRQTPEVTEKTEDEGGNTIHSSMLKRGKEKAEDEGGKGTQSISSSIRQTPEITEKTEDEGGKTIDSSMQKSIDNRPGSSQPPESNNVRHMFPLGLFHGLPDWPENIESLLLARYRQCNFEELVKNMKDDTPKIRKWYVGVERRFSKSEEELGRMMARDGLLLLEFLRFLADLRRLRRSSNAVFDSKRRQLSEVVINIENRIPIFVLKKILKWERDADKDGHADKDGNRGCMQIKMGSDGHADKDGNRGCMQIIMKTGEGDADADLDSILKHAWPELSPIKYYSHEIAGVPLKDDSHLLEFLYENIIGSSDYKWRKSKRRRDITLPQAEWLKGKGVKFVRNEGLLKKIRFDLRNGTLYLPAIEMDSGTGAVLRNLVLLEASKQGKESQPLMSYVNLMDRLIDTAEDVQALGDGGIIHANFGSNINNLVTNIAVANVWNGMCELINKKIKYEPIDKAVYDVNNFCTSKYRPMYTECYGTHFSKPWSVISLFAACILFGLTAFQTYLAWEQVRLQRESMPKT